MTGWAQQIVARNIRARDGINHLRASRARTSGSSYFIIFVKHIGCIASHLKGLGWYWLVCAAVLGRPTAFYHLNQIIYKILTKGTKYFHFWLLVIIIFTRSSILCFIGASKCNFAFIAFGY